eukprot:TRINITY_DN5741_c0_g1_i1.p1 TRINITY_DN5741_c0_g1~~TRINITY_DN5741_c0_g1_i1.p1  ORF type:complete len:206 (-),score=31.90 TRINITY_DN5741_c0_g1_i1:443-1060(-)
MVGFVLHLKNIPCKVLEGSFIDAMHEVGLDTSRYELYFPKRSRPQGRFNNFGYGFVHCVSKEDAVAFTRAMHGFRFKNINSSKQLVIEPGYNYAVNERERYAVGTAYASTQVTDDVGSNASAVAAMRSTAASAIREGMSFAEHDIASLYSCCTSTPSVTSCNRQPDAFEVPPTRLGARHWSLVHAAVDENDPLSNESFGAIYRFQ